MMIIIIITKTKQNKTKIVIIIIIIINMPNICILTSVSFVFSLSKLYKFLYFFLNTFKCELLFCFDSQYTQGAWYVGLLYKYNMMQQPTPSHSLSVKQELSQLRRHTQTRPPAWGVVRNKRPERLLTATTAWAYDKINTTELSHNFTPTGFLAHHNFVTVTWTWHVLLHAQNTPSPRHIFVKLIIIHHLSFDDWTRRGVIVLFLFVRLFPPKLETDKAKEETNRLV